jgi:hypothetical protein
MRVHAAAPILVADMLATALGAFPTPTSAQAERQPTASIYAGTRGLSD